MTSVDDSSKEQELNLTPQTEPQLRATVLKHAAPGPWSVLEERTGKCWLVGAVLLLMVGLFGWMLAQYWVGACPGVDQNGYMMTARRIAESGKLYFVPENPYQIRRQHVHHDRTLCSPLHG